MIEECFRLSVRLSSFTLCIHRHFFSLNERVQVDILQVQVEIFICGAGRAGLFLLTLNVPLGCLLSSVV